MAAERIGAAIDVGSNSVHLLVAAVGDEGLRPLADESVFLGLGTAVAEGRALDATGRGSLTQSLVDYAARAKALSAESMVVLGTEPVRRAPNASRIVASAGAAGVPIQVLTHEEEALLTLIGVTEGRAVSSDLVVVDVGGGSSEVCVVGPVGPSRAIGVRLGSASLTAAHVTHDPPTTEEVEAMRADARRLISGNVPAHVEDIVAVGGTATNLGRVVASDRAGAAVIDRPAIAAALASLSEQPAAEAALRFGVNPIRAQVLPAGAVILDAILAEAGADRLRISDASIREGALLVADHAGPAWRDRLGELAHGWRA